MSYVHNALAKERAIELQRRAAIEGQVVRLRRAQRTRQRAERATQRAIRARQSAVLALVRSV